MLIEQTVSLVRDFLLVVAPLGLIYHLVALGNPGVGLKIDQRLNQEYGVKKKFIPWLEENRMQLHNRLIRSKLYNIIALLCLAVSLFIALQI